MNNLTQSPPLFTDEPLSVLHSIRIALTENIRQALKFGRLQLMLPVWQKNLRRVKRVIAMRNLKTESV